MKVWIVLYCGEIEGVFNSYEKAKDYYIDAKMFCNPNDYKIKEWEVK